MNAKGILNVKTLLPLLVLASCSPSGTNWTALENSASKFTQNDTFPSAGNFRLSLVDKPKAAISEVIVNIDHVEMKLSNSEKSGRISFAKDLGQIDLLKLRNGVSLPLLDLDLPAGVAVTELRLFLKSEGNYISYTAGGTCDLKTPSAQQSGLKLKFSEPSAIEDGYRYSMIVDFDADKSVVLTGNEGCLLKPVLLIKAFERMVEVVDPVIDDPTSETPVVEEPVVDTPAEPVTEPTTEPLPTETSSDPVAENPDSGSVSDPATEPTQPVDDGTPYIDDFSTGGLVNYFQ